MELPKSILILAPHSDDETLLAAGLIHRAVSEGRRVSVALATNGDYLCRDHSKGETRLKESFTTMKSLGVLENNIYFLGYPDTGYEPEISFLNTLRRAYDPDDIFPSSCSEETYGIPCVKEDYAYRRTGQHAPYSRNGFEADLNALLDETAPELVITTSEWDQHGDHSALSVFAREALQKRPGVALWEGIVHSPAGDLSWPLPNLPAEPFTMPPNLERDTTLKWAERISLPVPADCRKYELIRSYKTALNEDEPGVVAYLLAFAKADEIFWKIK